MPPDGKRPAIPGAAGDVSSAPTENIGRSPFCIANSRFLGASLRLRDTTPAVEEDRKAETPPDGKRPAIPGEAVDASNDTPDEIGLPPPVYGFPSEGMRRMIEQAVASVISCSSPEPVPDNIAALRDSKKLTKRLNTLVNQVAGSNMPPRKAKQVKSFKIKLGAYVRVQHWLAICHSGGVQPVDLVLRGAIVRAISGSVSARTTPESINTVVSRVLGYLPGPKEAASIRIWRLLTTLLRNVTNQQEPEVAPPSGESLSLDKLLKVDFRAVPNVVATTTPDGGFPVQLAPGLRVILPIADMSIVDAPTKGEPKKTRFNSRGWRIITCCTASEATKAVTILRSDLDASSVKGLKVLGFDTEARPQFRKGGGRNPVALIQLASTRTVALFRVCLFQLNQCPALIQLLGDAGVLKVGIGANLDVQQLDELLSSRKKEYRLNASSFISLEPFIKYRFPRITKPGLRGLTATLLGRALSKSQQMAIWDCKRMSDAMKEYAACDAIVGLEVFRCVVGAAQVRPPPDMKAASENNGEGAEEGGGGEAYQKLIQVDKTLLYDLHHESERRQRVAPTLPKPLIPNWDLRLQLVVAQMTPSPEIELKKRNVIRSIFRRVIRDHYGPRNNGVQSVDLLPFGSSANGFASPGSDLDLSLMTDPPILGRKVKANGRSVTTDPLVRKILYTVGGRMNKLTLRGRGRGSGNETPEFSNVETIAWARVPLVKSIHVPSGFEIDIVVNQTLGVRNSALLRAYASIDPRVAALGRIVKRWAKGHGIKDTREGGLSSYAWIIMCIFYLQQIGLLPNLQAKENLGDAKRVFCLGHDVTFLDDWKRLNEFKEQARANTSTLSELVYGFFLFFGFRVNWIRACICIKTGKLISIPKNFKGVKKLKRKKGGWVAKLVLGQGRMYIDEKSGCLYPSPPAPMQTKIHIRDPFDMDHDIGKPMAATVAPYARRAMQDTCVAMSVGFFDIGDSPVGVVAGTAGEITQSLVPRPLRPAMDEVAAVGGDQKVPAPESASPVAGPDDVESAAASADQTALLRDLRLVLHRDFISSVLSPSRQRAQGLIKEAAADLGFEPTELIRLIELSAALPDVAGGVARASDSSSVRDRKTPRKGPDAKAADSKGTPARRGSKTELKAAGILCYRIDSETKEPEVLVGLDWAGKITVLGGKREGEEFIEDTAIREFHEETGEQLSDMTISAVKRVQKRLIRIPNGKYALFVFCADVAGLEVANELDALPEAFDKFRQAPGSARRELLEMKMVFWMPLREMLPTRKEKYSEGMSGAANAIRNTRAFKNWAKTLLEEAALASAPFQ